MEVRALRVGIYKGSSKDFSNNGISSRFDHAFVVCAEGAEVFDSENLPENLLVIDSVWGHQFARPLRETDTGCVGWMNGGALVYTSDSRFHNLSEYPLCLHDRQETQAAYEILSR